MADANNDKVTMINHIHILHLPHRTDRAISFKKQMTEQGIDSWEVCMGIVVPQMPFLGINMAHKRIIEIAKAKGLDKVTVMEDDVIFSAPGAWEYYVDNEPESYDIYFGSVYDATIKDNRIMFGFSALSLYTVHSRFYDEFLGMKEMNNLDKELGRFAYKNQYMVAPEFVCYQSGGFSDHQQKEIDNYDKYHLGIKFFGCEGQFQ